MKEALMLIEGNKKIKVDFNVIVKKINIDDILDYIVIDIEEENYLYENLTLIKGEIYPLPKSNDIIKIKEMYLDYDEYLSLRLFIKAEIISPGENHIFIQDHIYSFTKNKIVESLQNICAIKENLISAIFKVDSINDKFYSIFCLKDFINYNLSTKDTTEILNKNDFILIDNYSLSENEIRKNNITIIKTLTEEKLFQMFYKESIFGNKLILFKVIDINEKYYIVIDNNKKIYQIEKKEIFKNLGIDMCKLLLIKNKFKTIINFDYNLNEIILDSNDLIFYISHQNIYFSKLLYLINHFN